jgi:hypothetical protein
MNEIEETPEESIIFFDTPKSEKGGEWVLVSKQTFNGFVGLDVRAFYRRKDGTYSRSRKGLRLDPKVWKILIPEIQKAIAAMEVSP